VPKAIALDDEKPRRRRRAATAVVEQPAVRGWIIRILLHSPVDMVAGAVAFAAVVAIVANAIFIQAGRHPSPMFSGTSVSLAPANLLPRPRPVEADGKVLDAKLPDTKPVDAKPAEVPVRVVGPSPAVPASGARPSTATPSHPDPVGDMISTSRRVAAVQRALTEYGFGQLKATGTVGSDTQAAIQKFERERKLPVTGQMSDRLVRELATMTGRPIE
jgi:hypothetical protein